MQTNSPIFIPSPLAALHPSNLNNTYGKIISRSPGHVNHINSQENRSLYLSHEFSSPNKLNATKKPMISNKSYVPFSNDLASGNPCSKYIINNASPRGNVKLNLNGKTNFNQNNQNFNNINNLNKYFTNPVKTINNQPLINSNGYHNLNARQISTYQKAKYCENHSSKLAEFVSEDDGENGYCQKCAINLASKGYSVVRKNQFGCQQKSTIFDEHKIQPFHEPELAMKYGYPEISKFMNHIDSVHSSYLTQIYKYQTIESHYTHQYTITQEFYESLLNTVEQMRSDHLADLEMEAKKHTQLACIKEDHLKSDLEQLYVIRNDIVLSLGIILESFDSPDIQMAFTAYRQQISMFKEKIEEESGEFGKEIIDEKEIDLEGRLKLIESYLLNVWSSQNQDNEDIRFRKGQNERVNNALQEKAQKTIKNLFDIERGQGYCKETPTTAYRKLFDDEKENECLESKQNPTVGNDYKFNHIESENPGENIIGQTSPQFKNI